MSTRTAKQMAAGQRRTLLAIEKRIRNLCSEWEDIDAYNVGTLEDLADKVHDAANDLVEKS